MTVGVSVGGMVAVGGTNVSVGGIVAVFTGLGRNIVEVASSGCEVNGVTTVDVNEASASAGSQLIQPIRGPTMAAHAAITVAKPPMIATITSVFTPTLGFAGRTATTAFGNRLRV